MQSDATSILLSRLVGITILALVEAASPKQKRTLQLYCFSKPSEIKHIPQEIPNSVAGSKRIMWYD